MSKKRKRKFNTTSGFSPAPSAMSQSGTQSPAPTAVYAGGTPSNAVAGDLHAAEYRIIKHDLIKVVVLNALFLAGVLTLYYTNLHSGYLERWFNSVLKF